MDLIDVAQEQQAQDIERALARRKSAGRGEAYCIQADCGEPISKARQALGAQYCLDCQHDREIKAKQWAPRVHG